MNDTRPRNPDDLVEVASAATEFEASVIAAALSAEGIESRVFVSTEAVLGVGMLTLGAQPVRVMARASDADRARAALERNREESVDLDWDSVDVGARIEQAPTETDPARIKRTLGLLAVMLLVLVLIGIGAAAYLRQSPPGLP